MASQSEALRLLLAAIAAMREAGYIQEDLHELAADACKHIEAGGHQPHAFGHCINCHYSARRSLGHPDPSSTATASLMTRPVQKCHCAERSVAISYLHRFSPQEQDCHAALTMAIWTPGGFGTALILVLGSRQNGERSDRRAAQQATLRLQSKNPQSGDER